MPCLLCSSVNSIFLSFVSLAPYRSTLQIKNKFLEHTFEVSSFLFFVVPMMVICGLYILIGIKLHNSKLLQGVKRKGCPDVATNSTNKNNGNTSSGQARVIRMLGKSSRT